MWHTFRAGGCRWRHRWDLRWWTWPRRNHQGWSPAVNFRSYIRISDIIVILIYDLYVYIYIYTHVWYGNFIDAYLYLCISVYIYIYQIMGEMHQWEKWCEMWLIGKSGFVVALSWVCYPPCYQWVNPRTFYGHGFNSYVALPEGIDYQRV